MSLVTVYGEMTATGFGIVAANAELNSLPNNGIAICSAENWSNVQTDGQGGGWVNSILGRLFLNAPTSVYTAPAAVLGWILSAWDGSTYETLLNNLTSSSGSGATTSTVPPLLRPADFTWVLNIDSTQQAQTRDVFSAFSAPICAKNFLVIWNQSGQTLFTATTNAIRLYFGTDQIG